MTITEDLGAKLRQDILQDMTRFVELCQAVGVPGKESMAMCAGTVAEIAVQFIGDIYDYSPEQFGELMKGAMEQHRRQQAGRG